MPISTKGAVQRTKNEESEADDYLRHIAEPIREKGLDVQCVVLPGIAGETIINYAQENGCELTAIATHGHGGLKRLVLGSTADFVLHHSSIPVLIVRPGNEQV
jgi:nucleotide-binding universal stress UspA family protein